jgi:hypothetical protein
MSDSKNNPIDDDHVIRFGNAVRRCKAKTKSTGKRCTHPAVSGYEVCRLHGANPHNHGGPPKGNTNGLIHGAYVKKLLDEVDEKLFDSTLAAIQKDFDLNDSTDQIQAVMAAFYFTRWYRGIKGDSESAVGNYDVLLRKQLESLKATRAQRDTGGGEQTSPAEWAVALLERVKVTAVKVSSD